MMMLNGVRLCRPQASSEGQHGLPAARVLAHPKVAEADKDRLRAQMETADPVLLFARIRATQEELGRRVDRRGLNAKTRSRWSSISRASLRT
jgi:hypothetical protein